MRDELISNNLKLIDYMIFKMNLGHKLDDYYDIGLKALTQAGNTFDENKENKFSGYACICIRNEILKQIDLENAKKRQSNVNAVSFDSELCHNDNNNPITLLDVYDDGTDLEEEIIKQERIDLLNKIIAILEPNDRFMLEHYFELGGCEKLTYKKIGDRLGLKQRYVECRIKRAMRIIKKIMKDKYENN